MKRLISLVLCVGILAGIFAFSASAAESTAQVYTGTKSEINATTQDSAYITVRMLSAVEPRMKVKIQKGEEAYTYDLSNTGATEIYSLQMGSGEYTVKVLENTTGSKYAVVQTVTLNVTYTNEFAPYLIPVQNINYTESSPAIAKAKELAAQGATDLERINLIYSYIVNNVTYDTAKATQISTGAITSYLPNVDNIYATSTGICFDYSSLMAAMLRSIGIPTKLITGYVGSDSLYHAWNEVYAQGEGWIQVKSTVHLTGQAYNRMDSTFAAQNDTGALSEFIGNGSNYLTRYTY